MTSVALLLAFMVQQEEGVFRTPDDPRGAYLKSEAGLYRHHCAACHGNEGKGNGRYFPTELQPRPADLTQERLEEDIRQCLTGGSASLGKSNLCPPWGETLTKGQISDLTGYVASLHDVGPVPRAEGEVVDAKTGVPTLLILVVLIEFGFLGWLFRKRFWRKNHVQADPSGGR